MPHGGRFAGKNPFYSFPDDTTLTLTTCLLLLWTLTATAQFESGMRFFAAKPAEITLAKSLPLLVALPEEDTVWMRKLASKPERLAKYRLNIANANEALRQLVPKHWHFSTNPDIRFLTESELSPLLSAPESRYSILHYSWFDVQHSVADVSGRGFTRRSELLAGILLETVVAHERTEIMLQTLFPTTVQKSDVLFALRSIQTTIENQVLGKKDREAAREMKARAQKLHDKILLIDEAYLPRALTPEAIKETYAYPYQVVARSVIEAAVLQADARYACVCLVPVYGSGQNTMLEAVIDLEDGEVMAESRPGGMLLDTSLDKFVRKSNLKDFAKQAASK